MSAVLEGIRGNRFAIFGRAGVDLFADPIGTKAEHATQFRADLGGSSANAAAGLCKLGSYAALVTSVSDDAAGRFCKNRLEYYGVDTRFLRFVGGECRTSLAFYESTPDDFQNVIYRNNAADFQVSNADVDAVDYSDFTAIASSGTALSAQPSRDATFRAFEHAKAHGLPIIFDVDYRPYSWPSPEVASEVLTRAGAMSDMIIGNDEEFGFMAGGIDKGMDMARTLAQQSGRIVIYKMGAQGAVTFADGQEIRTGIYPVEALKPVGAGDSFMAGVLASIAQGFDLGDAILRGSACASITVSNPGCAPAMPRLPELEAFLKSHPGPSAV